MEMKLTNEELFTFYLAFEALIDCSIFGYYTYKLLPACLIKVILTCWNFVDKIPLVFLEVGQPKIAQFAPGITNFF